MLAPMSGSAKVAAYAEIWRIIEVYGNTSLTKQMFDMKPPVNFFDISTKWFYPKNNIWHHNMINISFLPLY